MKIHVLVIVFANCSFILKISNHLLNYFYVNLLHQLLLERVELHYYFALFDNNEFMIKTSTICVVSDPLDRFFNINHYNADDFT